MKSNTKRTARVIAKKPLFRRRLRARSVRAIEVENTSKRLAGVRLFVACDLLGRALRDDAAAAFAAFGTEIDDPIGLLDHVEVVLDDQHRITEGHEPLQNIEQLAHIVKVKARRRLVENVERAARLPFGKFAGELDALRFAARKSRRGLTKLHVSEPDFDQRRELLLNLGEIG